MANRVIGGVPAHGTVRGAPPPRPMVQEWASSYATQISNGDIIIGVSDGTVAIGAAANNGLLLGVVTGCSYVTGGKRIYSDYVPAATAFSPTPVGSANASRVESLPLGGDLILEVNGDAAAPTPTLAGVIGLIGENCDLATATAGSAIGASGMNLGLSTHDTTTANFRIIGISGYTLEGLKLEDNDPTVSNFRFLVTCNEGLLPPFTATGV